MTRDVSGSCDLEAVVVGTGHRERLVAQRQIADLDQVARGRASDAVHIDRSQAANVQIEAVGGLIAIDDRAVDHTGGRVSKEIDLVTGADGPGGVEVQRTGRAACGSTKGEDILGRNATTIDVGATAEGVVVRVR